MKRLVEKLLCSVLCAMLILSAFPSRAHAEDDVSLRKQCKYTTSNRMQEGFKEVWDTNSSSDYVIPGPGYLTISWKDTAPAAIFYLEWKTEWQNFANSFLLVYLGME